MCLSKILQVADVNSHLLEAERSATVSFLRTMLLLSSTLLGMLVTLQSTQGCSPAHRLCMAAAVCRLSLSILLCSFLLFVHEPLHARLDIEVFHRQKIEYDNPSLQLVTASEPLPKWVRSVEAASAICFATSVALLAASYCIRLCQATTA